MLRHIIKKRHSIKKRQDRLDAAVQLEFLKLLRIHLQSPWGWHGLML
jgi:hypothetical protein